MEKQITYDFGARQYSPLVPWWDRMDKMCEKYYNVSPYAFCMNNPLKYIDIDGNKPGDFFFTMDAAALDFGMFYNDNSIRENREYGAFIYQVKNKNGVNGYSYYFPTIGTSDKIEILGAPNGKFPVARIHTHGSYLNGKLNNEFSGIRDENSNLLLSNKEKLKVDVYDIGVSNSSKMDSYLCTPNGSLQKYNHKTGSITVLSSDLPSDKNDPDRLNTNQSSLETNTMTVKQFLEIQRNMLYEKY